MHFNMRGSKMNNSKLRAMVWLGIFFVLTGCSDKLNVVQKPMIEQSFRSVLSNETRFVCTCKELYADLTIPISADYLGYLNEMPEHYTMSQEITDFAVVDMDGDSVPEVVCEVENYAGFIVLRYREGKIYGLFLSYRGMFALKESGVYETEASAFEGGKSKMYFLGDTWVNNDWVYTTNIIDSDSLYVQDIVVDQATWDEKVESFYHLSDVEWHKCTEESIDEWIIHNPAFQNSADRSVEHIRERQEYLDSLLYLVEMTYGYERQDDILVRREASEYYVGCTSEMEKIYQLCREKLTGEELENLQSEQDKWLDNFNWRLQKDLGGLGVDKLESVVQIQDAQNLYWKYGDIIFRRTLALIDCYYDYHFYDDIV